MLYAIICTDKADGLELRMSTRPDHLAFLDGLGDALKGAGPFLSEDDDTPNGSLLVLEAASADEARQIAARDPYAQAGLFETVEVRPWKWLINNPEG